MSLIAVGLSFRSATLSVLERAVIPVDAVPGLLADLRRTTTVTEAMVVSTCNRVEVYGEVDRFHVGLQEISARLARATGLGDDLVQHLYVHFGDRAVQHLFEVSAGLDSMVLGESQVLGQVRGAFRVAQEQGSVGRSLGTVVPQALRVGKRAHSETGVDLAAPSVVSAGLAAAAAAVGPLAGRPALVVGAGSIGALTIAGLRQLGVGPVTVANRHRERGARFGGPTLALGDADQLVDAVVAADLVVSCTGAAGTVLDLVTLRSAVRRRGGRPLAVVDLALPHDVDPAAADLPGVTLLTLATLDGSRDGSVSAGTSDDVVAVRAIVAEEVAAHVAGAHAARVTPTVVALRNKADDVVAAELGRLTSRLPGLDARVRAEIEVAVRRVVDKLLHAPTVRVQSLAASPGGEGYAAALRDLFDLDPAVPDALATADLSAADLGRVELTDVAAAASAADVDIDLDAGAVSTGNGRTGGAPAARLPREPADVVVPLPREAGTR